MKIQPYLCYEGRCEEAINLYKEALGAEVVMLMRYKDGPEGSCQASQSAAPEKIMHATLNIGGNEVMVSDGMNSGNPEFKGITLSIAVDNDEQVKKTFAAISKGGTVTMELTQTFFASLWGMCADKFGVHWMVLSPAPVPAQK